MACREARPAGQSLCKSRKVLPLAKPKKSKSELEEMALKRVRAWPGCRGVASVVLTLDDDGEWSLEISDAGSADTETVRRAAITVGHKMHDEFDLATDS
jgi:hypothetical protein